MKTNIINLGPQHPWSHGVLRLILEIQGESIKNLNSEIGYLHRGTEKLSDYKQYNKILPYFDRLDYVSCILMEASYSLAIESLLNINISNNTNLFRIILMELTRIQNHLLAVTTNAMDIGWITPFLWFFEIRENLCVFFEQLSGARMHTSLITPGNNILRINWKMMKEIQIILSNLLTNLHETEQLLFSNSIWKWRTKKVGIINYQMMNQSSVSGILLRWGGGTFDHRIQNQYSNYNIKNIFIPKSSTSDIFDRIHLRIEEIYSSIEIILLTIEKIKQLKKNNDNSFFWKNNTNMLIMENVIWHFKINTENVSTFKKKKIYHTIESPKGEFGVLLVSNRNQNKLHRTKIRAPGFFHLQILSNISKNKIITDCLSILGSFDIVLGEIDK